MLCGLCNKTEATIHVTQIVNNQISEIHLCQICASKKGAGTTPLSQINIEDALTSLLNYVTSEKKSKSAKESNLECPRCHLTYAKFREIGRLGCPECYTTFAEELGPLLLRVHGSSEHKGKMPPQANRLVELNEELHKLRKQLQTALQDEDFETAARLRDAIKKAETN